MSVGRLRAESRPHRIEEQVLGLRFCLAVASRKRRRDGRVAEGARLESVFRGNSNVGSNPTLSASFSLQRTCGIATRFAPIFRDFSRNAVLGKRGKISAPQAESKAVP